LADVQDFDIKIVASSQMVRAHNGGHINHQGEVLPPFTVSIHVMMNGRFYDKMGLVWAGPMVREWCAENCTGEYWVGKKRTIHFHEEGDAILFLLSFK
jgi:hypothetical protein